MFNHTICLDLQAVHSWATPQKQATLVTPFALANKLYMDNFFFFPPKWMENKPFSKTVKLIGLQMDRRYSKIQSHWKILAIQYSPYLM